MNATTATVSFEPNATRTPSKCGLRYDMTDTLGQFDAALFPRCVVQDTITATASEETLLAKLQSGTSNDDSSTPSEHSNEH
jgi:hypothetical protein